MMVRGRAKNTSRVYLRGLAISVEVCHGGTSRDGNPSPHAMILKRMYNHAKFSPTDRYPNNKTHHPA